MKKKINFLKIIFILICLLMVSWLILFVVRNKKEMCKTFDFEEVLLEVNLSTNNSFSSLESSEIFKFMPMIFEEGDNYIFAIDKNTGDYFLLAENLNENQMFDLKSFIDTSNQLHDDKQIFFVERNNYVYAIYSSKYQYFIDGIIRNYIYC